LEQLLQSLKAGDMEIVELPNPTPGKGEILVRTHFSAISTGTEGRTVSDARKGYIAKAKSRKEEVSKVVKAARAHGLADTYKMVMNKLESLQPLGYSISGVVQAVGPGVKNFKKGDRVACGGSSASHAELVTVPENLAVHVPDSAPLDQAAFTTIGAIAMQGVRRAELSLGENCVVLGLGLIGQITTALLRAGGIKSFGVDLHQELADLALKSGADQAGTRHEDSLEQRILDFSNGNGVDAVIITAGSNSIDPIELAGRLCRVHGKVIVVGAVPTGFSRKHYYKKELDLRMSTSYGPGRYDRAYEESGLDYPIGQVRWTENRNMQSFAELLGGPHFDISHLFTHRFAFQEARQAFDVVVDKSIHKMGVLLEYDLSKPLQSSVQKAPHAQLHTDEVSVIGAGSFSSNFILPNLKSHLRLRGVLTSKPHTAENARRKFGFDRVYECFEDMMADRSGATLIATRHDTHAEFAIRALEAGKRVFLEKPLCVRMDDYKRFESIFESGQSPDLMLGFNRRFSPVVIALKQKLTGLPISINYRINAGVMPLDHWIHDPEIGGGRILGEVCHFIDLCSFLATSPVYSVSAVAMQARPQNQDTVTINLQHENGSIASISYFSNGNSKLEKESIEVFSGGLIGQIKDFKTLSLYGNTSSKLKLPKQDKGHAAQFEALAAALKSGEPFPVKTDEIMNATLASFAVVESINRAGEVVVLNEFASE
jgi:polar amino acid transport system substrate-binding protein